MVIYHSTPTLNLLLTPMEKWKRQSQKQKFQKCLQLIIWKTKVLLSFLRVRGHIDICFFVWKLIRLQIIFTKTAGIEIDLTVAPVCQKYWYKRFFWKLYSLLHISTWRRQWLYQSRYKFNLHKYSQSYKPIFTFCTFTFLEKYLSRQNKICQAVLKQKLKKSIILHLQKCTTNSISKNKITKKNTYLYYK